MAIARFRHVSQGDSITAAFYNELVVAVAEIQAQIDGLGIEPVRTGRVRVTVAALATHPVAGTGHTFAVTLDGSALSADEDFAIRAATTSSQGAPASAWPQGALPIAGAGPGRSVRVAAGTSRQVGVELAVPAGATSAVLSFVAVAQEDASAGGASAPVAVALDQPDAGPMIDGDDEHATGAIAVRAGTPPADDVPVTPGANPTFWVELDGDALVMPAWLTITTTFSDPSWTATPTSLVSASGAQLPGSIPVGPGEQRTIGVKVTVPVDARDATMTVRAASLTDLTLNESVDIAIELGESPIRTDPLEDVVLEDIDGEALDS